MMYPYITLADETEITHSHVMEHEGVQSVEVHFERPTAFSERQVAVVIRQIREAAVRAGAEITRQLEIVILARLGLAVTVLGLAVPEIDAGRQHLRAAPLVPLRELTI